MKVFWKMKIRLKICRIIVLIPLTKQLKTTVLLIIMELITCPLPDVLLILSLQITLIESINTYSIVKTSLVTS